jgi:hypothetical protein
MRRWNAPRTLDLKALMRQWNAPRTLDLTPCPGAVLRQVLDEARNATYPCRRFIAHRHCQHVLDLYLTGHYPGSLAAVPVKTNVLLLFIQTLLQMLQPLCMNRLPIEAAEVRVPLCSSGDSTRERAEDNEAEDLLAEDDDEELGGVLGVDEDYFHDQKAEHVSGERVAWSEYWSIPIVKFLNHATMSLISIVLLVVILYYPTMSQLDDGLLPIAFTETASAQVAAEAAFWIIYAGRVKEELFQFADGPSEYFLSFWNRIDILLFLLQGTAFFLRAYSVTLGVTMSDPGAADRMNQLQFDFQVRPVRARRTGTRKHAVPWRERLLCM